MEGHGERKPACLCGAATRLGRGHLPLQILGGPVARVERQRNLGTPHPDFASLNPGYDLPASAFSRRAVSVVVGVIASGSTRQCRMAGLPLASARSSAGANSSVLSMRSP